MRYGRGLPLSFSTTEGLTFANSESRSRILTTSASDRLDAHFALNDSYASGSAATRKDSDRNM
jgi:hypothetical protein